MIKTTTDRSPWSLPHLNYLKFVYLKYYKCTLLHMITSLDLKQSIGHWTLFTKLIYSGNPLLIVRILVFWYQTQQLCNKWGGSTSRFFTISNGVRQGGILSPKIFALYMNGLTDELCNSYAGCYINDTCINYIMYADHIASWHLLPLQCRICLMSVTIMELQMIFYLIL